MKIKLTQTAFLLFLILLISSCKKKDEAETKISDTSKPVITLKGDENLVIPYGVQTADPGATANDDKDGDLSANITSDWNSKVDVNNTGTYKVTYSVNDKSGNNASKTRDVTVKFLASSFYGEYNSTVTNVDMGMTSGVFSATVSAGDNPNQIIIYPFRGGVIHMKANISGTFGTQLSYSQEDYGTTSTGTGTIENGGKTINLVFTVNYSGTVGNMTQKLTRK